MTGDLTLTPSRAKKKKVHVSSVLFKGFVWACGLLALGILAAILGYILIQGIPHLNASLFAWKYTTENCSMLPSILNTFLMIVIALCFAIPLGIGSAIFLNEYANPKSPLVKAILIAVQTLSGVPSIVFGLFGMLLFVQFLHFGISLFSGALTLAIMVLPTIIQTSDEALRSLDRSWKEGSFALGAGKTRTIFRILLPAAMPGILSGVVLSMGRMMGETAALIYTSGTMAQVAVNVMEPGGTIAVHMYKLMSEGLYMDQASAVAVVLVGMVLIMNSISYVLEAKIGKDRT